MKKLKGILILVLFLALLASPIAVLASDISGARYYATILVSNSGTATTNVATTCNISTQNLINGGYLNVSANNCALRSSAGADLAFMPGITDDPWTWGIWVPAIGTNSYLTDILYTANSTGGKIRYFPDAAGMTATDDPSLELGANFTITQNGWWDTIYSANKTAVLKPEAFTTHISDNGSISSVISGNSTKVLFAEVDNELNYMVYGAFWKGQTFTANTTFSATFIAFKLHRVQTPDTITMQLWETETSDNITALRVVLASGTTDGDTLTTNVAGEWRGVFLSRAVPLINGRTYAVVIDARDGDVDNKASVHADNANGYAGGLAVQSSDNGTTWDVIAGGGSDFCFRVYKGVEVTATGVSSGEYTVTTEYQASLLANGDMEIGAPDDWGLAGANATRTRSSVQAKIGTYSLLLTRNGTDCYSGQDRPNPTLYANKDIAIGCWVYATVADRARIRISDGLTSLYSDYHSGVAGFEWLTVTLEFGAVPTVCRSWCRVDTGDTAAYFDGFVLVVGNSVLDGGNFILTVDTTKFLGIVSDNISVPNTSANWTYYANMADYWEYTEVSVNSTQVQSIYWEYDTTFYDSSGYDNDATPTFRTTSSDADVTAELTGFLPVSEAKAPAYALGEAPAFIEDTPVIVSEFGVTPPAGTFPLAGIIVAISNATNTPPQLPLLVIACFIILAASLSVSATMRKYGSGSVLVKMLVIAGLMGVFVALGNFGIEFWMIVVFLILGIALAMASRHATWN